jgi:hypothetical protein
MMNINLGYDTKTPSPCVLHRGTAAVGGSGTAVGAAATGGIIGVIDFKVNRKIYGSVADSEDCEDTIFFFKEEP